MSNDNSTDIYTDILNALTPFLIQLDTTIQKYDNKEADRTLLLGILREFLEKFAQTLNIEQISKIGDSVKFDPELHRHLGKKPKIGDEAVVVAPGWRSKDGRFEILPTISAK